MNIHNFIYNNVEPLLLSQSIAAIKEVFIEFPFSHLPVMNNDLLIGMISEDDIYSFENEKTLQDYNYALSSFLVYNDTHWLDVLEKFAQNETNFMPILDENNNYIGYYELADVLNIFSETPFLSEQGGELVVEKGLKDYSFSEVAQIVESNNGKLLGAFISEMNEDLVQITLKVSGESLNNMIQTFRRYSYNIVTGNEDDTFLKDLKERSDYLKKYLDI
jgi:Mg/Co/Ni transporter MgtE